MQNDNCDDDDDCRFNVNKKKSTNASHGGKKNGLTVWKVCPVTIVTNETFLFTLQYPNNIISTPTRIQSMRPIIIQRMQPCPRTTD